MGNCNQFVLGRGQNFILELDFLNLPDDIFTSVSTTRGQVIIRVVVFVALVVVVAAAVAIFSLHSHFLKFFKKVNKAEILTF